MDEYEYDIGDGITVSHRSGMLRLKIQGGIGGSQYLTLGERSLGKLLRHIAWLADEGHLPGEIRR